MLALFAVLATLSVAQGIVDVVLPTIRGEEPFGFLFRAYAAFGPAFLWAYVFVHNLGLACLVPGFGFLAAPFERRTENRRIIGLLLAGAVVGSLLTALQYMLTARERFDLLYTLPLFVGEALAVLVLALAAARELKGFVPTRRYEWSLVAPFRRLRVPFLAATLLLAALGALEAAVLVG